MFCFKRKAATKFNTTAPVLYSFQRLSFSINFGFCASFVSDVELPADWWGHKYGFVSGGFLGAESKKRKLAPADKERTMFFEQDQENLYNLVQVYILQFEVNIVKCQRFPASVIRSSLLHCGCALIIYLLQNKATAGKQGLGIKDLPKKIAGVRFQGKKTSLGDSDDEDSVDSSAESIDEEPIQTKSAEDEPKMKLKKLCKKLLRQVC